MGVEMVRVNGVDLCVETFGERGAPPILLVAGAAESMDGWDPALCRLLAGEWRFVIRYDHRDTGRSTSGPPGAPGDTGRDLVADACGLVDLLAGGRAHLVGLSTGGAIARQLAVEHPERVATLTLISTSPGPPGDVPPAPALVIHGSEDPLLPAGRGEAQAPEIPGSELLVLEGVGHQAPPRSTWDVVVPAILRHTDHRVRFARVFEAEVRAHDERFLAASGVGPRDRVLDIGCGTGGSTRDAARAATAGSVVGVDVSGPAIEAARRLSEAEGLANVTFLEADAQVHPFPPAHFDVCLSRFGVMFFPDPVAAFANLARALRPGARLVLLVWQGYDRNEASGSIRQALRAPPSASAAGAAPFSLGDPRRTERILAAAGFTDVVFDEVHEPVCYGPDVATACDFVLGLQETREMLAALDPGERGRARDRLRALLAARETESGVLFDARTWIITATRP